jgi:hypothetical protein
MEEVFKVYLGDRVHSFLMVEKALRGKANISETIEEILVERGVDLDIYQKARAEALKK